MAANTSFLQYTSLLSESNKIPPFHLPYTVTPIYSHPHIQSLPYTVTPIYSHSIYSHSHIQSLPLSLAEHRAVCCTVQCQYVQGLSSVTVPMLATRTDHNCSDISQDSQTQGRTFKPGLSTRPRISISLFHSERGPPNVSNFSGNVILGVSYTAVHM